MSRVLAAVLAASAASGFHLQTQELHEPEGNGEEAAANLKLILLMGTHHKTGTTLAAAVKTKIQKALGGRDAASVNMHWGRIWCETCAHPDPPAPIDGIPRGYAVAHFVRNPISAVISGYLYHRNVSGVLKHTDYGADLAIDRVRRPELMPFIKRDESYSSFLRHVTVRVGLQAELDRFFNQEYDEWSVSVSECLTHRKRCMMVCLEDFAHDYNAAWKKVIGHAGYDLDKYPDLVEGLSMHDVRLHSSKHVTAEMVTAKQRRKMAAEVDDLDRSVYGGKLAALPSELYNCGGSESERRSLVEVEDVLDAWA